MSKKTFLFAFTFIMMGLPYSIFAQNEQYDVNGDGKVDVNDITALVNVILDPYNGHAYVDLGLPSGTK